MKSNHSDYQIGSTRMELKYCEHCGGLWVREGGAGVYCEKCQPKVTDLPAPKMKPGKVFLPVAKRTVIEEQELALEDEREFEAVGGVA
jgi:hypothetical protein